MIDSLTSEPASSYFLCVMPSVQLPPSVPGRARARIPHPSLPFIQMGTESCVHLLKAGLWALASSIDSSMDVFSGPSPQELQKAMATHSNILAWRIPWTEDPGGLLSMGLHRVRHDCSDLACMHWRRKWQPTPVFFPGEYQGWRSLVGCCLWGRTELDTTEVT